MSSAILDYYLKYKIKKQTFFIHFYLLMIYLCSWSYG